MRALCGYGSPTVCAPDPNDVQSEFGRPSGDRFFQGFDSCRNPGHVAMVHDYLHAVTTSVRMCIMARFISLSNGSQDERRSLQPQLVLERVAFDAPLRLARLSGSRRSAVSCLKNGVHCCEIARRSPSLIGQHTLQSVQ